jgi:hypothetical protein
LSDADLARSLLRTLVGSPATTVPSAHDWGSWRWFAQRQRVVPLLYQLANTVDHDLRPDQARELRSIQGNVLVWAVRLEHQLLEIAGRLNENCVAFAVLKGLATAHLDYPSAEWRQFGDIDLLVAPECFAQAIELLEKDGWVQGYALPRGHRSFTHAVTFTKHNVEVDLHQRVAHRAIGLMVPTGELLRQRRSYAVADQPLWALSDVHRLIHAALHASLSRGETRRLSSIADVLVMSQQRPDLARFVADEAVAWSTGNLVMTSIATAHEAAGLQLPDVWNEARADLPTPSWEERVHLDERRRPWAVELAYLRRLPTWGDRSRYIGGHLYGVGGQGGMRSTIRRVTYLSSKARSRRPPS